MPDATAGGAVGRPGRSGAKGRGLGGGPGPVPPGPRGGTTVGAPTPRLVHRGRYRRLLLRRRPPLQRPPLRCRGPPARRRLRDPRRGAAVQTGATGLPSRARTGEPGLVAEAPRHPVPAGHPVSTPRRGPRRRAPRPAPLPSTPAAAASPAPQNQGPARVTAFPRSPPGTWAATLVGGGG